MGCDLLSFDRNTPSDNSKIFKCLSAIVYEREFSVFEFLRTVLSPQSVECSLRIRPVDARTCCFAYKSFSFFSRCGRYPQYQMFFRAGVRRHALGRLPKAETVIGKRGIPSLWWMLKLPYEKKTSFTHSISFHNMFVLYLTDTINPALHLVRSPVTRILIVIKRLHTDMMRSQLNRS